jgi:hypothetical protein
MPSRVFRGTFLITGLYFFNIALAAACERDGVLVAEATPNIRDIFLS